MRILVESLPSLSASPRPRRPTAAGYGSPPLPQPPGAPEPLLPLTLMRGQDLSLPSVLHARAISSISRAQCMQEQPFDGESLLRRYDVHCTEQTDSYNRRLERTEMELAFPVQKPGASGNDRA
jgi:hypothetical protein